MGAYGNGAVGGSDGLDAGRAVGGPAAHIRRGGICLTVGYGVNGHILSGGIPAVEGDLEVVGAGGKSGHGLLYGKVHISGRVEVHGFIAGDGVGRLVDDVSFRGGAADVGNNPHGGIVFLKAVVLQIVHIQYMNRAFAGRVKTGGSGGISDQGAGGSMVAHAPAGKDFGRGIPGDGFVLFGAVVINYGGRFGQENFVADADGQLRIPQSNFLQRGFRPSGQIAEYA